MTAELLRVSSRIFLVSIAAPNQTGEAEQLQAKLLSAIAGVGGPCVVITDCSQAAVLLPHVRASYLQVLKTLNGRIERGAFLIPTVGPFGDQIVKLVEQSDSSETRQVFTESRALVRWLNDMLSVPEQVALKQAFGLPIGGLPSR